ncbi:MAG TPA: quinoprotein dehydrogenase-associated putative ABC transporter substrate-binding protein [Candidatus Binatia bacterium]|nr:quinoprotein dehydrogenase-associated putative ABC transporter substrate-binding protein [Candidatus Binatia bacterium]
MGRRRRSMILIAALMASAFIEPAAARTLRVCADPNNMPFSNLAREGFENRIVELAAQQMGATVEYIWRAQRRGYVREGLNGRECDVLPGVASNLETVLTTRPYYRSSYVFLWRTDRRLQLSSLDDPRLADLTIGVQMVGDDFSNTPPAHALARRGHTQNIRGYMIYGDYGDPAPAANIIRAVARGDVDAAVVWGPLAGYFASRADAPLSFEPIEPRLDPPGLPMTFDISMAVRRDDPDLRRDINRALLQAEAEIDSILARYDVPRPD